MPPQIFVPPLRLGDLARPGRGRRRALISLTPLIDVVFILVVFFMLASSFLDWRAIDLNTPVQAAAAPSAVGAVLVEVRSDGLRLSGQRIALDDLVAHMRDRLADDADRRVLVRASAGVALQEVITVLDRLSGAGVADLSLIRDPAG